MNVISILGSKYTPNSNLNEIEIHPKSNLDMSSKGGGAVYEWPTADDGQSGNINFCGLYLQ